MSGNGTFIYSPDIRVYIRNFDTNTIIDVSRDVEDWNLERVTGGVSRFQCQLNNQYNRYSGDSRINVMDAITVFLRRIEFLQEFTGYVTYAPVETAIPGTVSIRSDCTVKRLKDTYWDPHTPQARAFFPGSGVSRITDEDGNVTDLDAVSPFQHEDSGAALATYKVLTAVGGWDARDILIQRIPVEVPKRLAMLLDEVETEGSAQEMVELIQEYLSVVGYGANTMVAGTQPVPEPPHAPYPFGFRTHTRNPIVQSVFEGSPRAEALEENPWDSYIGIPPGSDSIEAWQNEARIYIKSLEDTTASRGIVLNVRGSTYLPDSTSEEQVHFQKFITLSQHAMDALGVSVDDKVNLRIVSPDTPLGPISINTLPEISTGGATTSDISSDLDNTQGSVFTGVSSGGRSSVDFLQYALAQRGDRWVFNEPQNVNDPDPDSFDCSGLIWWAAVQIGYPAGWEGPPPGVKGDWSYSVTQRQIMEANNSVLTIDEAIQTAGALLVRNPRPGRTGHIAISLGNGYTIEALSAQYGVNIRSARERDWDMAGYLPGMHFPGPISNLPSGHNGEGPPTVGGGFKGATGPVTPIGSIGSASGLMPQGGQLLPGPFSLQIQSGYRESPESILLTGDKAFINDEPLLKHVSYLCQASLREFQSAPDGKFIAWYPDYFGFYGKTPTIAIRDIETVNFDIYHSDDDLATHVAIAGMSLGFGGAIRDVDRFIATKGVVTVEQERLFSLLAGLDVEGGSLYDSRKILQRFGLRPFAKTNSMIMSREWEWMTAVFVFMEKWASWTQCNAQITFMPELYPGMRVIFPDRNGIEMYVRSVSHRGSSRTGYTTTFQGIAPVRNGKLILEGLPKKYTRPRNEFSFSRFNRRPSID